MKSSPFLLLIISVLFTSTLSGFIHEYIPSLTLRERFKNELHEIEKLRIIPSIQFKDYTFSPEEGITLTWSSIQSYLNVLNPDMLKFTVTESGDNPSFSWSYAKPEDPETKYVSALWIKYKAFIISSEIKDERYQITITINASNFGVEKHWEIASEKDKFYVFNAKVKLDLELDDISTSSETPIQWNQIIATVRNWWQDNTEWIRTTYENNAVNGYYRSMSVNDAMIQLYTNQAAKTQPKRNIVSHVIESIPKVNQDMSSVTYLGKVNNKELVQTPELSEVPNTYAIVIDKHLIQDWISESWFDFNFNESSKPLSDYALVIKDLKLVCSQLKDIYDDNLGFSVRSSMISVAFGDVGSGVQGDVTLKTDFISDEDKSTILSINSTISFSFNISEYQHGINFNWLSKNVKVANVVANPEPARTLTDEEKLKKWIEDSLVVYLARNEYHLLYNSFDLNRYFKMKSEVRIADIDRFYKITGEPWV